MYPNLVNEMKNRKVSQEKIATLFSGRQATISYKMIHHKFYVDEAMAIRDKYFPDLTVDFLFGGERE